MRFARVIGVAVVSVAVGCSSTPTYGGGGGGGGGVPANQVWMQGTAFNPATRTVAVHTTVTWINQDPIGHTVTKSSGPGAAFDSGTLGQSAQFQVTFDSAGTYEYYCKIHGSPGAGMHGTVVVQ